MSESSQCSSDFSLIILENCWKVLCLKEMGEHTEMESKAEPLCKFVTFDRSTERNPPPLSPRAVRAQHWALGAGDRRRGFELK